jgi:RNA polymerase sigma factor (sigma-70 family)
MATAPQHPEHADEVAGNSFSTTEWSAVLQAANADPERAKNALNHLCRRYWQPLYKFICRRGYNGHDAEDLTQAFFARFLDHQVLQKVDRSRGKFRTFLLASVTNFLSNEWDKAKAEKRGGKIEFIALDHTSESIASASSDHLTPEGCFDREWASVVVRSVFARLSQEYEAAGKTALYKTLEPAVTNDALDGFYARAATDLNMSEGAVKVALHRFRRRFGELLRSEVAQTVASPEEVDEEIRALFAAIGT